MLDDSDIDKVIRSKIQRSLALNQLKQIILVYPQ